MPSTSPTSGAVKVNGRAEYALNLLFLINIPSLSFSERIHRMKKTGTKVWYTSGRYSANDMYYTFAPGYLVVFHIPPKRYPRCSVSAKPLIRRFFGSFSCALIITNRCSLVNSCRKIFLENITCNFPKAKVTYDKLFGGTPYEICFRSYARLFADPSLRYR